MTAAQRGNVEIVKLLLKHGAKPNLRNTYGDTAIIFAANLDRASVVEELIKAGADVNGGTGQSALIMAVQSGANSTVKLLLKKGADPNFHRPGYSTPLEYAIFQYDDDIVAMLKKAGAKGKSKAEIVKERAVASARITAQYDAERKALAAKDAQFAKLIPEDTAVIEAAIGDLARYSGADFEISSFTKAKNLILLDETEGRANEYTESQMNGELSESQAGSIDLAMRRDLLRRNRSVVSLAGLTFSDSRIFLRKAAAIDLGIEALHSNKKEQTSRWAPDAKGWVQILLPGFSDDGTRAVLRFWFGPTPHGAAGTCLLIKRDGRWQVQWRVFAHYL